MDNFTPKEERKYKRVGDQIHFCLNCQVRDSGDWIWVMGERYNLEQLFDDFEVNEELREKMIAQGLYCKNCGTELMRYDEIGLEDKYDKEISEHIEAAIRKYGKRINELGKGIKQHPTLALSFPLARTIFNEIAKKKLPICSVEGIFYRARKVSTADVLKSDDFLAPPIGLSQEGRFNHSGQSHFYIADSKETAIYEVINDDNPILIWLQEFEIKPILDILDLSFDWDQLGPSTSTLLVAIHNSKLLTQSKGNSNLWKPDYNVTRFIMDCAKYHGYKGIKYNSIKDYGGKNVVQFECNKDLFISYKKPEIIIHSKESDTNQFNDDMIKDLGLDD